MNNPQSDKDKTTKTITEELEVAGSQLVERVQDVIREGNVRRLVIKTSDDRVLMDTTLTLGALAGGALAMVYWPLAAVAAVAAAFARVKVEIVREVTDENDTISTKAKSRIEITGDDES